MLRFAITALVKLRTLQKGPSSGPWSKNNNTVETGNSNSPLTDHTKSNFPWIWPNFSVIFNRITRMPHQLELNFLSLGQIYLDNSNSGSFNLPRIPSHWQFLSFNRWEHLNYHCNNLFLTTEWNEQITYLTVISQCYHKKIGRVTVPDEISLICTLVYTEVLKNQ